MATLRSQHVVGAAILGALALMPRAARADWHPGDIECGYLTIEDCPPAYWIICQCVYPKPGFRAVGWGTCAPPAYLVGGPKTVLNQPGQYKLRYGGQSWCLIKYECRATGPDNLCDPFHPCYVPQPPEFLGIYDVWINTWESC
jgi:hypothetical protein